MSVLLNISSFVEEFNPNTITAQGPLASYCCPPIPRKTDGGLSAWVSIPRRWHFLWYGVTGRTSVPYRNALDLELYQVQAPARWQATGCSWQSGQLHSFWVSTSDCTGVNSACSVRAIIWHLRDLGAEHIALIRLHSTAVQPDFTSAASTESKFLL